MRGSFRATGLAAARGETPDQAARTGETGAARAPGWRSLGSWAATGPQPLHARARSAFCVPTKRGFAPEVATGTETAFDGCMNQWARYVPVARAARRASDEGASVWSDGVRPVIASAAAGDTTRALALREALVSTLIAEGEIPEGQVADAMRRVPRHAFVPDATLEDAYANHAVPIGLDQTISQPAVVAMMTQALELRRRHRVLEIGTGSGYQAAVLALLARAIFSVEIVPELADEARRRLAALGLPNVAVRTGDGYRGWPEQAPFDRILLTAAPEQIPPTLIDQLTDGGLLVAPIGPGSGQTLVRYRKSKLGVRVDNLGRVAFVPMVSR